MYMYIRTFHFCDDITNQKDIPNGGFPNGTISIFYVLIEPLVSQTLQELE
jgi:hypothetical protein